MAVVSTKGLVIELSVSNASPLALVPTDISSAAPAVITVADTTGMTDGDVVHFVDTGFEELDNKLFIVGNLTGTTFEAVGSNTTNTTGTLGGSPSATVYLQSEFVTLCLSEIAIDVPEPTPIDISTFCSPGASLPGNPQPGSISFTGYTDITDSGYLELLAASREATARMLNITIPQNGNYVAQVTIGSATTDIPLEGSVSYTFTSAMNIPLAHRF